MSEKEQLLPALPYYTRHSTCDNRPIPLYHTHSVTSPGNNFSPQQYKCGKLFEQPYQQEIDVSQSEIIPSGA
jgi:hypothetical protein